MVVAAVFLMVICYGAAGYLWWRQQTPIFLFGIFSGHIGALASPLWSVLYGVVYRTDLAVMAVVLNRPLYWGVVLASAWFYTLPALLVFYLYQARWWFPGYVSGLLTYVIFLLYHLVIETIGLRANTWAYTETKLPLGVPAPLLSAMMAALISLGLLYIVTTVYRSSWPSMLALLLPATLAISLLVHGLLGAPLWIALILPIARDQIWALNIGMLSTLALLAWSVHILTSGLRQVDRGAVI